MTVEQLSNESAAYRQLRRELLEAEIALRNQREKVAQLRRQLPLDTVINDYVFHEGPTDLSVDGPIREVRLSELFDLPDKPVIVYQYMYGEAQTQPCPMCTMWVDGFNGIARHLKQVVNFAVVAQGDIREFRSWARKRDWTGLRLLSSAGTSFKRDLNMASEEGGQHAGVSVFSRTANGSLRHFYSGGAHLRDDIYRGLDLLTPLWSLLDLSPQGRGDWFPSLEYREDAQRVGA